MQVILIILAVIIGIILLVILFKHFTTKSRLKSAFSNGNVIVTGRKGYGKDILFQDMIAIRKKAYLSNLNYGGKYIPFSIKELELTPNDFNNFIKGNVTRVTKNERFEKTDIYISDAGVYLPSQADYLLHKVYPSLPITYALNRHLYDNGIHCNAQRIERIYKALREQADYFVLMRKRCLKLPFVFVLFTTEYDRYESARQELQPMNSHLFNKYSKAERDLFTANHGYVKNGLLIVPKWRLKYDSRAFHEVVFGNKATKEKITLWKRFMNILKGLKKKEKNT